MKKKAKKPEIINKAALAEATIKAVDNARSVLDEAIWFLEDIEEALQSREQALLQHPFWGKPGIGKKGR